MQYEGKMLLQLRVCFYSCTIVHMHSTITLLYHLQQVVNSQTCKAGGP